MMKSPRLSVFLAVLTLLPTAFCAKEKDGDTSPLLALLLQPQPSGNTSTGATVTAQLRYMNNTGTSRDFVLNSAAGCPVGFSVAGTNKALANGATSTYFTVASGIQGTGASLSGHYAATLDAVGNLVNCFLLGTVSTGTDGRTYTVTITGAGLTLAQP